MGKNGRMYKDEVISLFSDIEKRHAQQKIDYQKAAGIALLDNDELRKKWCDFVEKHVNSDFDGILLDETLLIIALIKSNVQAETIAQIIKKIPDGQIIIDGFLTDFISPEILFEIQSYMDSKKL